MELINTVNYKPTEMKLYFAAKMCPSINFHIFLSEEGKKSSKNSNLTYSLEASCLTRSTSL